MSCENVACHQQTRSTVRLGDIVIVLTSLHASLTSTRNCERPSQAPSVFTESITTFQSKFNPLSLVNLEPLPLALVPLFQKTAMTFTPLVQVRSSVVLPQGFSTRKTLPLNRRLVSALPRRATPLIGATTALLTS